MVSCEGMVYERDLAPDTVKLVAAIHENKPEPSVQIDDFLATLQGAFDLVYKRCPGIRDRLVNAEGRLREHINISVGSEDIRYTGDFSTPLHPGDEISILPAISGG
jgi:molybdopterin converting factor small subunit